MVAMVIYVNMDATKKPLRIPPEFARYAEEKEIFQLLEVTYTFITTGGAGILKRALVSHLANATRTVSGEAGRPARVYDNIPEETGYER